MDVSVLWLFLMVPWAGLQSVIMVFPVHSHVVGRRGFRNTWFGVAYLDIYFYFILFFVGCHLILR